MDGSLPARRMAIPFLFPQQATAATRTYITMIRMATTGRLHSSRVTRAQHVGSTSIRVNRALTVATEYTGSQFAL